MRTKSAPIKMTTGERTMRIVIIFLFASGFLLTAIGQDAAKISTNQIKVHELTLTASDLQPADLEPIAASLEGGTYPLDELQDRVQQKLRDRGYYLARAENPQLTNAHREGSVNTADVSVQIEAGNQYRMGQIAIRGATAFPADKLKTNFTIPPGSPFNSSALNSGLEKLKSLYENAGYADVGAVPSIAVDEAQRIIDVTIEIEEGAGYNFGQLMLEGPGSNGPAGKALLAAWRSIEGKRYSPEALKKWIAANGPKTPPGAPVIHPHAEGVANLETHRMNVRLKFE